MNDLKWKDRWNEIKGRIKRSFGNITDDDLRYKNGQEDEMIGRLQDKTGKSKKEVHDWLNDL